MVKEKEMTWLEIMDVLDNMPLHLLKKEAELWHYDEDGVVIDVLPIQKLINPDDEKGDYEWRKGGNYSLSFWTFDSPKPEPEPRKFYVDTTMNVSAQFCIQADSKENAFDKMRFAICNKLFFDSVKDDFDFDEFEMFDTWDVTEDEVYECFDNVDPIDVDSFIV